MERFHNRTRTAVSIPRKLRSEGRPHLLPLYYLLTLSDLAKEGMERSGSYQFADHIYGGRPSGRYGIGRLIDGVLLRLPSARALRQRYLEAKAEITTRVEAGAELRVLSVPCGLARELFEAYGELAEGDRDRIRCYGLDLDGELVERLRDRVATRRLPFEFFRGEAFDPQAYPSGVFDLIISMGFTEFLSDEDVVRHYGLLRAKLAPGGILFASAMRRHAVSDYLLRNLADLHTHYREAEHLRRLCRLAGFQSMRDRTLGLQTIVLAEGPA